MKFNILSLLQRYSSNWQPLQAVNCLVFSYQALSFSRPALSKMATAQISKKRKVHLNFYLIRFFTQYSENIVLLETLSNIILPYFVTKRLLDV